MPRSSIGRPWPRTRWLPSVCCLCGALLSGHSVFTACARPVENRPTPAERSTESPGPNPASPLGRWLGYLEAFGSQPGSDRIELVLEDAGAEKVTGSVRIGTADASVVPDPLQIDAGDLRLGPLPLAEGKTIPITGGRTDGERVRFDAEHRAWHEWCAEQTPSALGPGLDEWGCPLFGSQSDSNGRDCRVATEPSLAPSPDDGGTGRLPGRARLVGSRPARAIDCAVLGRCWSLRELCECRAQRCSGRRTLHVQFDIRIEGAKADGSAVIAGAPWRVRLEKSR